MLQQKHRHQAFIINMDQTPYNPKDTDRRTLNEKGVKTVNAKTMKTSLDRITCMLAVCADGTKLPPLLVFKAKPGRSVEREQKHRHQAFNINMDQTPYNPKDTDRSNNHVLF